MKYKYVVYFRIDKLKKIWFIVKGGGFRKPSCLVALTGLHQHYGTTRGPKGVRAEHPTPKGKNASSHPDTKATTHI